MMESTIYIIEGCEWAEAVSRAPQLVIQGQAIFAYIGRVTLFLTSPWQFPEQRGDSFRQKINGPSRPLNDPRSGEVLALLSVAVLVLTSPTGQSAALFVCSCKDCRTFSHQPVRFSSLATLFLEHILPVFACWTWFKPHWSSVHHWSLAVRHCWNLVGSRISGGQIHPVLSTVKSCWSEYHLPSKSSKDCK